MDLFLRARDLGIQTEFTDGQGQRHVTDEAALKIIVNAFPARTPRRFVDGPVVIRTSLPDARIVSKPVLDRELAMILP